MTGRILGIGAGAVGGSAEIALVEALRAAEAAGAVVGLVRLETLHLPSGPEAGGPDDAWWLWDQLLDSDGLIVSAPLYARTIPARLKLLVDRLLGPNADRAIVERLLEMRDRGEEPAMAFRVDDRVLRPRVAGFIAVGGALTPQWHALALPAMHMLTFSMQTAVVDQMLVTGTGTPQSIVLDDAALARAGDLGRNVASQLGRTFDEAEYLGPPGLCPLCHLDVVELRGTSVACATCGTSGRLRPDLTVEWTDLTTSVISVDEKRTHFEEILMTAEQHAKLRDTISRKAASYASFDSIVSPR